MVPGFSDRLPYGGHNVETLSANKTLITTDAAYQKLDPNAASRDVTLPAEGDSLGKFFIIVNNATGSSSEILVIKNDAGSTLLTLTEGSTELAFVVCDGTTWEGYSLQPDAKT